jgi:deoxyribodipyrimidine photolyase
MKKYKLGLFIFRRDLRIIDNTGLNLAGQECEMVAPVFILDDRQISPSNQWRSLAAIKFMVEAIKALNAAIEAEGADKGLIVLHGPPKGQIKALMAEIGADWAYMNEDYTPFARLVANEVSEGINGRLTLTQDYLLLNSPYTKDNGEHFKKFTPFYNSAKKSNISGRLTGPIGRPFSGKWAFIRAKSGHNVIGGKLEDYLVPGRPLEGHDMIGGMLEDNLMAGGTLKDNPDDDLAHYVDARKSLAHYESNKGQLGGNEGLIAAKEAIDRPMVGQVGGGKGPNYVNLDNIEAILPPHLAQLRPVVAGGRPDGLNLLKRMAMEQKNYDKTRDILAISTTHLSAHIKFGTISIREAYWAFMRSPLTRSAKEGLVRQLYWRDFYYNLLIGDPNALVGPYDEAFGHIKWKNGQAEFEAWKNGRTGFPIVDACMRELNETNYMHNRGRLIVSSFLVKNLLIDWRKGEQYFASQLVDYDPCVNFYNWQFIAGTGPFAQPYFRVLNPWRQSLKHDPDAIYIKRWIPELANVPPSDIHDWANKADQWREKTRASHVNYPRPIVDYEATKEAALAAYKAR